MALQHGLPSSVLYVKNGRGGKWWPIAQKQNQIHAGWSRFPAEVIRKGDVEDIKREYWKHYPKGRKKEKGRTADLNMLVRLLDRPSQHVWITFEGDYLWWCMVGDRAQANSGGDRSESHFWLSCRRSWSNKSIKGKLLSKSDLPGPVRKVAGFRGTVGMPKAWKEILRVIQGQTDSKTSKVQRARSMYEQSIKDLIQDLNPYDFEHLVELILVRSGWERVSELGKQRADIDLDVVNPAIGEHAFVQVKSEAGQSEFDRYCTKFGKSRARYGRMIFAVHSPKGQIRKPNNPAVQIWTGDEIARLVVRLGLGERLEKMRA